MADTHNGAGLLMAVVRECFYVPDGKAPDGYHDGRDVLILRHWLERGGDPERIEAAIRGTALLRDRGELRYIAKGEKITLRALNPKVSRWGRHLFQTGADAWEHYLRERARRQRKPLGMDTPSDVLARLGQTLIDASRKAS